MDMKKLIESMDHISECGIDEGPMGAAPSLPAPEMDKGNPVTVNVSMNASGKEHVADLLNMMKNAGLGDAEPVGAKMLSPRMDMERLSAMMDEPGFDDKEMELPADLDVEEEDYANEPDPKYGDMSDAIPDGNDLNRKKKAYPATQDGDNPMAVESDDEDMVENIKSALYAALTEKKKSMVKGPDGKMVPDYAADGKGKDDLAKGKKDTKTTEGRGRGKKKTKEEMTAEGRGKVMAGRGRGKDKLMAGRGRGKKK